MLSIKGQLIDTARLRSLAVQVGADPRTIQRILLGGSPRGMRGHVVRELLRSEGLIDN